MKPIKLERLYGYDPSKRHTFKLVSQVWGVTGSLEDEVLSAAHALETCIKKRYYEIN